MKYIFKLLSIITIIYVIYFITPFITIIMYALFQIYEYDHSFYTLDSVRDYHHKKISFYTHEMEKSYEDFIYANTKIEIFKAEVMNDLATNCIEYYLHEIGERDLLNASNAISHNARNKATKENRKLITKFKKNDNLIGENFYTFDLNLVNAIENKITNPWRNKTTKSICSENFTAEELYNIFLPLYVKQYTEKLTESQIINHSINEPEDEQWLKDITNSCNQCPQYKTFKQRVKAKKQMYESLLFDMAKGKIKMQNYAYMVTHYGVNLNIVDNEGKTPLFYLINSKNGKYYIDGFIKYGADIHHKDKYGKTVFDYINENAEYIDYHIKVSLQKANGENAY